MIEIQPAEPDTLLYAVAHGRVTADDYERVLFPAVEAKLAQHKRIRMLYQLAPDFEHVTAGAMWDDTKFSLTHLRGFDAVALVTDVHWIQEAYKFFAVFMRIPIRSFSNAQLAEAREWVTATTWRAVADVPVA